MIKLLSNHYKYITTIIYINLNINAYSKQPRFLLFQVLSVGLVRLVVFVRIITI